MSFDESLVNRQSDGQFGTKTGSASTVTLSSRALPDHAVTRFENESEWIQKHEDHRELYAEMEGALASASSFAEADEMYGSMLGDRNFRGRGVSSSDVASLASHAAAVRTGELRDEGVPSVRTSLPEDHPFRDCDTSAELHSYRQLMTVDEPHRERELTDLALERGKELRNDTRN